VPTPRLGPRGESLRPVGVTPTGNWASLKRGDAMAKLMRLKARPAEKYRKG
jgi:hypothetical protein